MVEEYCREYLNCDEKRKAVIQDEIRLCKKDILAHKNGKGKYSLVNSLYSSGIILPCLFNTGCCIGKHGITSIELNKNDISLVHWFDCKVSQKYLDPDDYKPIKLKKTDFYRVVLKRDYLDYIMTRIKLLS